MSLYLDYNSTTPIDKRVLDVMIDVYQNHIGNADSRPIENCGFVGERHNLVNILAQSVPE